jgi:CO/xanthine dehydrogenase Mo-binding subunit
VRGKADRSAEFFRLEEDYTTPVEHHNPIELCATIASWKDDYLTVSDSTRWIVGSRKTLARHLDMPEEKVRIICPYVGGSFGSKAFLWQHVVLAALAARAVKRRLKLVLTRAQMFTCVGQPIHHFPARQTFCHPQFQRRERDQRIIHQSLSLPSDDFS